MNKRMIVTAHDLKRLIGLPQFHDIKQKASPVAVQLIEGLRNATTLPSGKISRNVITMNSRALLTEISSGRQMEVTVTYPQDADHAERKVSVLSHIGVVLLGRAQGDIVSWKVPGGAGDFRIEEVTYQPEADGDYYQ